METISDTFFTVENIILHFLSHSLLQRQIFSMLPAFRCAAWRVYRHFVADQSFSGTVPLELTLACLKSQTTGSWRSISTELSGSVTTTLKSA